MSMNRIKTLSCRELFGITVVILAASAIQGCSMMSGNPDSSSQIRSAPAEAASGEISRSLTTPIVQIGMASWYGPGFNGKATASGDIYDEAKFTAAHKTLPLGSKARVVNLKNGKSVEVLINDRGPHLQGRILDLSQASAKALGMIDRGVAKVQIQLIQATVASDKARLINRQ